MKSLSLVILLLALGVGFSACGGSSSHSRTARAVKMDRDDDSDNNDDDDSVIYFGHAPTTAEKQPLVALVTAYYAAQASENGTEACRLLMPFVAESVVEDIGHSPHLKGRNCAAVMSKLFTLHHKLLAGENSSLKFYTVRISGDHALTVLSFANLPEVRQLSERRDSNGTWRVLRLLDGIVE